jgi:hypothetical protein
MTDTQAEQLDDPDHARKMRVLSTMERVTKEALVEPLQRAGISTEPDPEMVAAAESFAEAMAAMSWVELVSSFEPVTADLLVAHELALRAFGRLEGSGDGEENR